MGQWGCKASSEYGLVFEREREKGGKEWETYSVCGGQCESVRNIINAMERCGLSDSSRTIL